MRLLFYFFAIQVFFQDLYATRCFSHSYHVSVVTLGWADIFLTTVSLHFRLSMIIVKGKLSDIMKP